MMQSEPLSGEARLRARRTKFILFVGAGIAIAFIGGVFSGVFAALIEDAVIPAWTIWPLLAAVVAGFSWFTYRYYQKVDELDLADNLWANTFGLYFYIFAAPTWFLLNHLGQVPPPHHLGLLLATIGVAMLAYLIRKLRLR